MRPWAICRRLDLALVLVSCPALADCPATGATYRLSTDPTGAIGELTLLADPEPMAASNLLLQLVLPEMDPILFDMTQSQGYGSTAAFPRMPSPLGDVAADGLPLAVFAEAAGRLVPYGTDLPQQAGEAPAALFLTDLGVNLWYGTGVNEERIFVPSELWYRHACGG